MRASAGLARKANATSLPFLAAIAIAMVMVAAMMVMPSLAYLTNPQYPFTITITAPASAAGSINYHPAMFGPSVPSGGLTLPIRYLAANINGTERGCVTTNRAGIYGTTDALGRAYAGGALMVKRGACGFDTKTDLAQFLGAAMTIIYNTDDELFVLDAVQYDTTIPVVLIGASDGADLINGMAAAPATTFTVNVPGTGTLDAAEKTAFNQLVNALSFGDGGDPIPEVGVRPLSTQLADPTLDPCTNRTRFIWCENGHITAFYGDASNFAEQALPTYFNAFTKLKMLVLSSNAFTGAVPCLDALTQLAYLNIAGNSFTSLPSCSVSGSLSSFIVLKASANALTSVATNIASMTNLLQLDLSSNALTAYPSFTNLVALTALTLNDNQFTGSLPSFRNFASLQTLTVRNNGFSGTLASNHFDGCTSLAELDVAHNSFTGDLPNLSGASDVTGLDFSYNAFSGTIPDSWKEMKSLTSLVLSNNKLVSPFTTVGLMDSLISLDLSYNQFTTFSGDGDSIDYSLAALLITVLPDGVVTVNLRNNNFTGVFDANWCCGSGLRELDFSYNQITALPSDLFGYALTSWDSSYNLLTGSIPSGTPGTKWQTLKFAGNPGLVSASGSTAPAWTTKDYTSLLKEQGTSFVCPTLGSVNRPGAAVTLDASYYGYSLCSCDAGTYGLPPNCNEIPAIGATPVPDVNMTGIDYKTPLTAYGSITDAGFGSSRVKQGMDTSWLFNTTAMLQAAGTWVASKPALGVIFNFSYTGVFTKSSYNSMGVYSGGTDLQGERLYYMVGDGSAVASTDTYWAVGDVVTMNFQSREQSGTHFSATYLFAYTCPSGYELSGTKCVKTTTQYRNFQKIFGVLILIWQCGSMLAASCLLYVKRAERLVGLQSPWFLASTIFGFFFIIEPPIVGIVNDTFPCGVTYWFDLLWQPILMTSILMIMGRLYVFHEIQKARKRLLNKQKMDKKRTERLTFLGSLVQPQRQVTLTVAAMVLPILTIIISYSVDTSNYKSPNKNCTEDTRLDVIQLVYWIVYMILLGVGLVALQNARDAFGLSRRVVQFGLYYSIISIVYFVLKFAARSSQINPFDFRYLQWLIVAIFQVSFVIRPLARTFPLCQRAIDDKDVEPLDQMLATKLGFAYIKRHCEEEFSVENVLCWAAIDKFQKKTTVAQFLLIREQFVGPTAHMQVNIARTMEKQILAIEPDKLSGEQLQSSLDPVKEELFNLILRDSYPRFLASPLAKRYVQKLPLEFHDTDGPSVSGSPGGGTGGTGDGSGDHNSTGSRGGGVTSKIEMEEKKAVSTKSSSNLLANDQSAATSQVSQVDSHV